MPAPGERINRFLARCGEGSRRQVEELVRAGRVAIDGRVSRDLATRVEPGQRVTLDGRRVEPEPTVVFAFHKPAGVLCTRDDPQGRQTIYDLLPGRMKALHYVGRLDRDSEGLLLLTNDGELTLQLTHPRHEVEKEYLVTLNQSFNPADGQRLLAGIQTEEGPAKAIAVHLLSPRRVVVVLQQGLKRQVRLMFAGLEYRVKRLVRVRIGKLTLEGLPSGRWRQLGVPEIAALTAAGKPSETLDPALKKRSAKVEKELSQRREKKAAAADKRHGTPGQAPRRPSRPTRNSHLKGKAGAKRWKRH